MNALEAVESYRSAKKWGDLLCHSPTSKELADALCFQKYPLSKKEAAIVERIAQREAAEIMRVKGIIEKAEKAVEILPIRYGQDVVKLFYFEGLHAEKAADKLFLSAMTFRRALYASRKWLQEQM